MELVEISLEGLRSGAGAQRWTFPPGASFVPVEDPASALVARAAFAALSGWPDASLAAQDVASAAMSRSARVGVVAVGRQRCRVRLVLDPVTDRRALQTQRGNAWETVATTTNAIDPQVSSTLGVLDATTLRDVSFVFAHDLPSRRRAMARRAARGTSAESSLTTATSGTLQDCEFALAALQHDVFLLDAEEKPLLAARGRVAALRSRVDDGCALDRLGDDFPAASAALRRAEADLVRKIRQFDDDEHRIHESARGLPVDAYARRRTVGAFFARDPWIVRGLAVGLSALLLGCVGAFVDEGLRWLALLDIPAFGVAALGALRVLGILEDGAAVRGRLDRVAMERAQERARVATQRTSFDRRIADAGFATGDDGALADRVAAQRTLREQLQAAEHEVHALETRIDSTTLQARRKEVERQIAALELRLSTANARHPGGPAIAEDATITGVASSRGAPDPVSSVIHRDEGGSADDHGHLGASIAALATMLSLSKDDAAARITDSALAMVTALCGPRFVALAVQAVGDVSVVDADTRTTQTVAALPEPDADRVALAIRLAVAVQAGRRDPLPLVLDRCVDHLPAEALRVLGETLRRLGDSMQVICLTTRRELVAGGATVTASFGP